MKDRGERGAQVNDFVFEFVDAGGESFSFGSVGHVGGDAVGVERVTRRGTGCGCLVEGSAGWLSIGPLGADRGDAGAADLDGVVAEREAFLRRIGHTCIVAASATAVESRTFTLRVADGDCCRLVGFWRGNRAVDGLCSRSRKLMSDRSMSGP